ncbi:HNH/ENDO VII family nuclease [Salinithrix halophila]|uniref:HNH/ENDO VII family nuclease n=1 Tax=Salinithrix halophila TaxID=1485204 RepID=A0ABV8JB89_9BACL
MASDVKNDAQEFVDHPWESVKDFASDTWEGMKYAGEVAWKWTKEHKEEIAAGVGLLFVPGGQAFGAGILIGAAFGGGLSAAQGNDLKTVMLDATIGGLAGAVGGGVSGGVASGIRRYVGQKAAQLMGNSIGGAAGSIADNVFRGHKINWKSALVSAVLAGAITNGIHAAQKPPVFGITPKAEQAASQAATKTEKVGLVYQGLKNSKTYSPADFEGTVKVGGQVRDVSRRVYQRKDIDWNAMDPETGLTNFQLAKAGRPPIGTDGKQIELHHVIQKEAGPMVEIMELTHDQYHKQLHGLIGNGKSFRNDPVLGKQYNNFRKKYWRWRARQMQEEGGN